MAMTANFRSPYDVSNIYIKRLCHFIYAEGEAYGGAKPYRKRHDASSSLRHIHSLERSNSRILYSPYGRKLQEVHLVRWGRAADIIVPFLPGTMSPCRLAFFVAQRR